MEEKRSRDMNYKVTQEGSIQGIEPIYNQTVVSEDYLESQVRLYLEPYFHLHLYLQLYFLRTITPTIPLTI
jgi:hypothetical protein